MGATMMKLGCFLEGTGHHVAAWRDPDVDPYGRQSLAHYLDIARIAERGKFDLLFMADTNATFGADDVEAWTRTTAASRLEPITLLGAIAAVTERIGLVATATTTYFEPFHVARFFASLDQISGGRAGWNLVTSLAVAEAYNFGRETHPHHGDRYARAREFAKVVLGLWDSFEDGAVIADKAERHLSGPLETSFPQPQGQALFGARAVDRASLAAGPSGDRAGRPVRRRPRSRRRNRRDHVHGAAGSRGRPGVLRRHQAPRRRLRPSAQRHQGDARRDDRDRAHPRRGGRKIRALAGAACRPNWRSRICRRTSASICRRYPLDGPVPDPASRRRAKRPRQGHGGAGAPRESDHPPALQARLRPARSPRGHRHARPKSPMRSKSGSAAARRTASTSCRSRSRAGLQDIVDLLIPELQRRGLFRKEYEGKTLRENLGLPIPENRWAVERAQKNAG